MEKFTAQSAFVIAWGVVLLGILFKWAYGYKDQTVRMVTENQFLQAVLVPSFLGIVGLTCSFLSNLVYKRISAQLYCSITINNKDENYFMVLEYVSKKCIKKDSAAMAATTKRVEHDKNYWKRWWNGISEPPQMEFLPADDSSISTFLFEGKKILLVRQKGETVVTGWERKPVVMERLTISCWGRSNGTLKNIIKAAINAQHEQNKGMLTVYAFTSSWGGAWEKALTKPFRKAESVVLDGELESNLINDAKTFMTPEQAQWYRDLGIPYRRGYLLHGPPGCGKTTFCQVLAGALDVGICILNLSDKTLDDNSLATALREAPNRAMVVLEDIDAVFIERSAAKGTPTCSVTFSGLLNALDGVASQEGRILFMTTNHIDRLDEALIRPGRCDVKVLIRRSSRDQQRRLFLRFHPGETELSEKFCRQLPEYVLSMAQVQGYLLEHRANAERACNKVKDLLQSTKPHLEPEKTIYEVLRRVNLQDLTPYLHHFGYFRQRSAIGLTADTMENFEFGLRYRKPQLNLLQKVFEDPTKVEGYETADIAVIRDSFKIAYRSSESEGQCSESDKKLEDDLQDDLPGLEKLELQRANSQGLYRRGSVSEDDNLTQLEQLENEFVNCLVKDGRSQVSVMQLNHLLQLCPHNPVQAIEKAFAFTAPFFESWKPASARGSFREMTVFQFLCRANLQQYTCALEQAGVTKASQLVHQKEDDLKSLGISPDHVRLILGVVANGPEGLLSTNRFRLSNRSTLRYTIRQRLQQLGQSVLAGCKELEMLLDSLTDEIGNGKVSLFQLEAYLGQHLDQNASDSTKEQLLAKLYDQDNLRQLLQPHKPTPVETPPPTVPTEWIYSWLKGHGLEEYANSFIQAKLCSKEDLCLPPLLSDNEIKNELGISSLGDRRRLLQLLGDLQQPSV